MLSVAQVFHLTGKLPQFAGPLLPTGLLFPIRLFCLCQTQPRSRLGPGSCSSCFSQDPWCNHILHTCMALQCQTPAKEGGAASLLVRWTALAIPSNLLAGVAWRILLLPYRAGMSRSHALPMLHSIPVWASIAAQAQHSSWAGKYW